jgi:hypothetical protein
MTAELTHTYARPHKPPDVLGFVASPSKWCYFGGTEESSTWLKV